MLTGTFGGPTIKPAPQQDSLTSPLPIHLDTRNLQATRSIGGANIFKAAAGTSALAFCWSFTVADPITRAGLATAFAVGALVCAKMSTTTSHLAAEQSAV